MTLWVAQACEDALSKLNVRQGYLSLGYIYADDASYAPKVRDLDYQFVPGLIQLSVQAAAPAAPPAPARLRQPKLQELFAR